MCHTARFGASFVTIINYFLDQLMGLLEFPKEVFVSKIAIQKKKYFLSTCVWMFVGMGMVIGMYSYLHFWEFSKSDHAGLWITTVYPMQGLMASQVFLYIALSDVVFCLVDLPVNRLVSSCWLCLVYTSSSGCWTITRQQKEWAFPEALYTTTTCDTVRNTNWTQSMLLLLGN